MPSRKSPVWMQWVDISLMCSHPPDLCCSSLLSLIPMISRRSTTTPTTVWRSQSTAVLTSTTASSAPRAQVTQFTRVGHLLQKPGHVITNTFVAIQWCWTNLMQYCYNYIWICFSTLFDCSIKRQQCPWFWWLAKTLAISFSACILRRENELDFSVWKKTICFTQNQGKKLICQYCTMSFVSTTSSCLIICSVFITQFKQCDVKYFITFCIKLNALNKFVLFCNQFFCMCFSGRFTY